jgi:hypothetical protein
MSPLPSIVQILEEINPEDFDSTRRINCPRCSRAKGISPKQYKTMKFEDRVYVNSSGHKARFVCEVCARESLIPYPTDRKIIEQIVTFRLQDYSLQQISKYLERSSYPLSVAGISGILKRSPTLQCWMKQNPAPKHRAISV